MYDSQCPWMQNCFLRHVNKISMSYHEAFLTTVHLYKSYYFALSDSFSRMRTEKNNYRNNLKNYAIENTITGKHKKWWHEICRWSLWVWRAKVSLSTSGEVAVHLEESHLCNGEPQWPHLPKKKVLKTDSKATRRVIRKKLQEFPSLAVVKLMRVKLAPALFKGTVPRDFHLRFFSSNSFPWPQ